ncbi:hypothetical protein, partial [Infirmifilum sp.]|uniref:hypothetical protein n=1 Tax=Infirmifilum sp. TaxID=2856575 RepID=UPI003D0BEB79
MSKKYIFGILALAILALALTTTAQAAPVTSAYVQLLTPWGKPFANQNVIIVVFNETGNCIIAYAQGTTDAKGKINLQIASKIPILTETKYKGSYNISVFWQAYGKTFLLNTTRYTTT